jgi:hypothetical protein
MDTIFVVTFLLLVIWRCSHPEPVAPDDPMLYALAACIVVWRYVYRAAARYDAAHEAAWRERERGA